MPLWLQGALESAQAAVISALVVAAPILAVWATAGFLNGAPDALARLAGQAWLLIHGVPLLLDTVGVGSAAPPESGVLSLTPLGLTLIPFLLAWRAGRRLARASYTDQLWQALLGSWLMYAAFGLTTGFVCRTDDVGVGLWSAALIPLIPFGLGMVIGARREAGSWSRLIGVDAVAWLSRTSQHSRWAGSYLGSAIKAGFVALMASLAMSCALLAATLFIHWNLVIAVYEALDAGALGGAVLTIAQLGFLPNLAVFALAWTSGAGVALGVGSQAGALGTAVGPLPSIPVFAALPAGSLDFGVAALVVPVLAGTLAGWWFLREGRKPLRRMALDQDPRPLVHRHGLHAGARRDGRQRRRAARGGTGLAGPRLRRHRTAHGDRPRPAPDGTVRGRGGGDRRRDRLRRRTVAGTPAEAARSGPGDGVPVTRLRERLQRTCLAEPS